MTKAQSATLEALRACDGAITAGMLAEMAGITPSGARGRINSLVALGLAESITYDRCRVWLLLDEEAAHDKERIYIDKTAPGRRIVRFAERWKPQPAIRPRRIGGAE